MIDCKKLSTDEIVVGLEELIKDRKSFIFGEEDEDNEIFRHDIVVLEAALEEVRRMEQIRDFLNFNNKKG